MPNRVRVTETEAVSRLLAAGYMPLEPYPGGSDIAWRMQCKSCKAERSIRLNQVRRSPCKHARRPLKTHEQACAVLAEIGFEPVEPFPGSSKLDWRVKCAECGEERNRPLRDLRLLHPCSHSGAGAGAAALAEAEVKAAGFEPQEPYPGHKSAQWKASCATCGQPRIIRLSLVQSGYRCGHRGAVGLVADPKAASLAADEAIAAGYEPLEPYPGQAVAMWKMKCMECERPRTTSLSMIRSGRRCAHTRKGAKHGTGRN